MAKGVNKVFLIGHLGNDPEIRYAPSGDAIGNFQVATTDKWKGKDGQTQEHTEWHKITVYKKHAEIAKEYLKKGSKVYVEGSLKTRKWQDKGGTDHYTTEVICKEFQMLDSKKDGSTGDNIPPTSSDNDGSDIPF